MFDAIRTGVRRGSTVEGDSWSTHRRGSRVAVVAIIVVALAALALEALVGLRHTVRQRRAATVAAWNATYAQEECLYRAIRADLPKGARVVVGRSISLYYSQILIELATPWVVPQPTDATAQWRISLVHGPECSGVSVRSTRVP